MRPAGFANLVFNRYLDLTDEDDGIAAMPLFLAMRAVIRAHVTATMAAHGWSGDDPDAADADARRYLDDAEAALQPEPPRLVAIGGSAAAASRPGGAAGAGLGRRPGARGPAQRRLAQAALRHRAGNAAAAGSLHRPRSTRWSTATSASGRRRRCGPAIAAVIDAVALREDERRAFADVAAEAGVPFTGLWLAAPEAAMAARLGTGTGDASDASAEVLRLQLGHDPGVLDWTRIDAGGDPDATLVAARAARLGQLNYHCLRPACRLEAGRSSMCGSRERRHLAGTPAEGRQFLHFPACRADDLSYPRRQRNDRTGEDCHGDQGSVSEDAL